MDYRTLLKKHIDHIGAYEGINFINGYIRKGVQFTDAEVDEIFVLAGEVMNDYWAARSTVSFS